jgi:excisionase family DNA binding protein
MSADTPFMTERQAADQLGLDPRTLRKWRWLNEGPAYYKFGKAVRYKRSDLEDFMSKCRMLTLHAA